VLADSRLSFLPRSTADAIRCAAQAVAAVRSNAPPDDLLVKLRAVRGVDDSTIQFVAMRALNDSDALPAESAELRGALGDARELIRHAERWKPWRAYAATLLMEAGGAGRS
jgi:AraC family transcriptional regulator of adaptative response / DNA-3-methyladenine glycosylase II